jgi:hypothetical protein
MNDGDRLDYSGRFRELFVRPGVTLEVKVTVKGYVLADWTVRARFYPDRQSQYDTWIELPSAPGTEPDTAVVTFSSAITATLVPGAEFGFSLVRAASDPLQPPTVKPLAYGPVTRSGGPPA